MENKYRKHAAISLLAYIPPLLEIEEKQIYAVPFHSMQPIRRNSFRVILFRRFLQRITKKKFSPFTKSRVSGILPFYHSASYDTISYFVHVPFQVIYFRNVANLCDCACDVALVEFSSHARTARISAFVVRFGFAPVCRLMTTTGTCPDLTGNDTGCCTTNVRPKKNLLSC